MSGEMLYARVCRGEGRGRFVSATGVPHHGARARIPSPARPHTFQYITSAQGGKHVSVHKRSMHLSQDCVCPLAWPVRTQVLVKDGYRTELNIEESTRCSDGQGTGLGIVSNLRFKRGLEITQHICYNTPINANLPDCQKQR